jgi:oligopeptidase B
MTAANAPAAKKEFHKVTQFGETRIDAYHWLRGPGQDDWQQVLKTPDVLDADVRAHLEAENTYFDTYGAGFAALTQTIGDELVGRIVQTDSSVPVPHGPYEYWVEYREGGNYPIHMRRERATGATDIMFDGDKERGDSKFFDLATVGYSPDHSMIAYGLDREGSEYYNIRFRDIKTGQELPETLTLTNGDIAWSEDASQLYYIECNDNHRPKKVKVHVLGTDPKDDHVVYEEEDDGYFLGLSKTQSRDYILIGSRAKETSEVRYLPSNSPPDAVPTLVRPRETGVEYSISHGGGDHFYLRTNIDGATEYKVMRTPINALGQENWVEIVPHNEDITIAGIITLKDFMVRQERAGGLPRVVVSDYQGSEYIASMPDQAYTVSAVAGPDATKTVRLSYLTPVHPGKVMELDLVSGKTTTLKEKVLPNGHDPAEYIVERKFLPARDGTDIPVTIVRHNSTTLDGASPLHLYGYGSYGASIDATFSSNAITLADRGIIYAIAHIRGGGEMGKKWYLDGKKLNKLNTFTDFIDVAEGLTDQGYGRKGEISIEGASAGGMLMGAVANMRPDLFTTVIASVPFVDVLNTISDPSLPLTPPEWAEWGDPINDREIFDLMKTYSPYDNVRTGVTYPAILATAGLTDYRVTYWEPAKWIAKLRDEASGGPFYLKTQMNSGHFGSAARFELARERSERYAFVVQRFEDAGYDMSIRVDYGAKLAAKKPDAPGAAPGPTAL